MCASTVLASKGTSTWAHMHRDGPISLRSEGNATDVAQSSVIFFRAAVAGRDVSQRDVPVPSESGCGEVARVQALSRLGWCSLGCDEVGCTVVERGGDAVGFCAVV